MSTEAETERERRTTRERWGSDGYRGMMESKWGLRQRRNVNKVRADGWLLRGVED